MANMKKFHTFMAQFMPILLRQKYQEDQVRMWLEKSLAEYEAYGKTQEETQNRSLQNAIIEALVKSGLKGAEDLDRPLLGGIERLGEAGVGEAYPELRLPTPQTSYEESIKPYQDLASDYVSSQMGKRLPEAKAIMNSIKLRGSSSLDEWVKDVMKSQQEKKAMDVRGQELGEKKKSRELAEKTLGQREKEYETETKGGRKKSDLTKDLTKLRENRWKAIEDIEAMDEEIDEKEYKALRSKIFNMNTEIKSLKKKTGSDPDESYAKAAKELKEKGYSKADLFEDQIKRLIDEKGLSIWILLEYF